MACASPQIYTGTISLGKPPGFTVGKKPHRLQEVVNLELFLHCCVRQTSVLKCPTCPVYGETEGLKQCSWKPAWESLGHIHNGDGSLHGWAPDAPHFYTEVPPSVPLWSLLCIPTSCLTIHSLIQIQRGWRIWWPHWEELLPPDCSVLACPIFLSRKWW